MSFHWGALNRYLPLFIKGLQMALCTSIYGLVLAYMIGVIGGLARLSSHRVVKAIAYYYVMLIRGTPLLVQTYLVYFGLPFLNINLSPLLIGILAIGLNSGAYLTEIVRGGILSVQNDQIEAAHSLGLNNRQTMMYIVFPQALKVILAPSVGQLMVLVKDTAVLSTIGVLEIMRAAQHMSADLFRFKEAFLGAAGFYLIICSALMIVSSLVEKLVGTSNVSRRQIG